MNQPLPRQYLEKIILASGKTKQAIADSMSMDDGCFRMAIYKGRFNAIYFKKFAAVMQISEEELQKNGVLIVEARKSKQRPNLINRGDNLLPVIKIIAASGIKSISLTQIIALQRQQSLLKKTISPVFVREFLKLSTPT